MTNETDTSALLLWKPTESPRRLFKSYASSDDFHKIIEVVGSRRISKDQVPMLRGVATATGNQFFNEVADVVDLVAEIEISLEPNPGDDDFLED